MKGKRKIVILCIALVALLIGLGVVAFVPAVVPAFSAFVTGVGAVTAAAMAGNAAEHFAEKGKP